MRNGRALAAAAFGILLACGIALWWPLKKVVPNSSSFSPSAAPAAGLSGRATQSPPSPASARPDPKRATILASTADGKVEWPGAASETALLNRPEQSAREDIDAVHTMIADYRSVFGEVPLGGLNEEFTRALQGDNPKKIVFLAAKAGTVNDACELLDRWGTPYFFHKLSRRQLDLRSAGPDRKMFTADDIFEESSNAPPL